MKGQKDRLRSENGLKGRSNLLQVPENDADGLLHGPPGSTLSVSHDNLSPRCAKARKDRLVQKKLAANKAQN